MFKIGDFVVRTRHNFQVFKVGDLGVVVDGPFENDKGEITYRIRHAKLTGQERVLLESNLRLATEDEVPRVVIMPPAPHVPSRGLWIDGKRVRASTPGLLPRPTTVHAFWKKT